MKNIRLRWISGAIVFILVVLAGVFMFGQISNASRNRPNIIFILTDDLDFPLMPYLKNTDALIGEQGATFYKLFCNILGMLSITFIHASPDMTGGTRVVAIFDWEMATLGDPLADLGYTLIYWTESGDPQAGGAISASVTIAPGFHTRAELIDAYARATGRDVAAIDFYQM